MQEKATLEEQEQAAAQQIVRLLQIMRALRGEHGCPWDKEQTHQSLKRYLIEETYEAVDAIEQQDDKGLCGELGDVLLQVVFHSQIATEEGRFTFGDVAKRINDKMVYRHPHVFGGQEDIHTAGDVLDIWEVLKSKENLDGSEAPKEKTKSVVDVPRTLPALLRAQKIQEKAARVGFDWPDVEGALDKLQEEVAEVKNARTPEERQEELGDVLFALVNVCRFMQADAEEALTKTNEKFLRRFEYIEENRVRMKKEWQDFTLEEMDNLWEQSKKLEKLTKK